MGAYREHVGELLYLVNSKIVLKCEDVTLLRLVTLPQKTTVSFCFLTHFQIPAPFGWLFTNLTLVI